MIIDEKLPGLADLSNSEKATVLLNTAINKSKCRIREAVPDYIRYKPGTNCIIGYLLKCRIIDTGEKFEQAAYAKIYTPEQFTSAFEKAASSRWSDTPTGISYLALPDQYTILFIFPNDCLIDSLHMIGDSKKLQRLLYMHLKDYPESRWRISNSQLKFKLSRYKPERRAVVFCKTKAYDRNGDIKHKLKFYIRFYADLDVLKLYENYLYIYEAVSNNNAIAVPEPIGFSESRKLILLNRISGKSLTEYLTANQALTGISAAAQALADFHRLHIPLLKLKPADAYYDDLYDNIEMLKILTPENTDRLDEINSRLQQSIFLDNLDQSLPLHGDFHPGQILINESRAGLLDFDRTHAGDPAEDVANFIANLIFLSALNEEIDLEKLAVSFNDCYRKTAGREFDKSSLNSWITFCLIKLSPGYFRNFVPGWQVLTSKIIDVCIGLLNKI